MIRQFKFSNTFFRSPDGAKEDLLLFGGGSEGRELFGELSAHIGIGQPLQQQSSAAERHHAPLQQHQHQLDFSSGKVYKKFCVSLDTNVQRYTKKKLFKSGYRRTKVYLSSIYVLCLKILWSLTSFFKWAQIWNIFPFMIRGYENPDTWPCLSPDTIVLVLCQVIPYSGYTVFWNVIPYPLPWHVIPRLKALFKLYWINV